VIWVALDGAILTDAQTDAEQPQDVAASAVALIGLFAFDAIVLLPVLTVAAAIALVLVLASLASLIGGFVVMVGGPFTDPPSGTAATVLAGLAFASGAISVLALLTLGCLNLGGPVMRYTRLHLRLLKAAA
jgi:uncharacterized membrane protein